MCFKKITFILSVECFRDQSYDHFSILYVTDLCNVSEIFEPIMFPDDANLFFSQKNIKELFHTANLELNKVFKCFNANKLSLIFV